MARTARWAVGAMATGFAAAVAVETPLPRDFSWQAKVHPGVLAAPAHEEQELLLVLRERADLSGARNLTTREEKTRYVFERLTEVAARTQEPLLEELRASGTEHQSFWITNVIRVRARAASLESLARRSDVARIEANAPLLRRLPLPETPSSRAGLFTEGARALAAGPESNIQSIGAPAVLGDRRHGPGRRDRRRRHRVRLEPPGAEVEVSRMERLDGQPQLQLARRGPQRGGGKPCGSNAPAPCDDGSHGTHTMGIAVGDDGAGNQIGVAPGARWIGCRNMDRGVGTPARYTECFQWFLAPTNSAGANPDPSKAPDIINNSWDCPPSEGCTNPDTLKDIIENVRAAGIVVVIAGGNDGPACSSMEVPGPFEACLNVGATDSNDEVASFSSRGPGQNGSIKPQVVAPGTGIRSCVTGSGYAIKSGTSMAAPHAAGLAALLISAAPSLSGNPTGLEVLLDRPPFRRRRRAPAAASRRESFPTTRRGGDGSTPSPPTSERSLRTPPPAVSLRVRTTAPSTRSLRRGDRGRGIGRYARRQSRFLRGVHAARPTSPRPFPSTGRRAGGSHELTAVATDDQGASTVSAPISITVEPPSSLPVPWTNGDVGAVGVAGSASHSAGTFSVSGSGGGIGGTTDKFHFVSRPVSGDVPDRGSGHGSAEHQRRLEGRDHDSREPVARCGQSRSRDHGRNRYQFQRRVATGLSTSNISGTQATPAWVKLVRVGNTFTGFRSSNGTSWTSLGSHVVAMAANVEVGLAMTSGNSSLSGLATFDNVTVTGSAGNQPPGVAITSPADGSVLTDPSTVTILADASDPDGSVTKVDFFDGASLLGTATSSPYSFLWSTPAAGAHALTARATDNLGSTATSSAVDVSVSYSAGGLPAPWVHGDVGAVGVQGSASHSGGTFSVSGSGGGIGGTSDKFHFVSQSGSGNVQIVARVTGVQNTSAGSKGGIMIRESLAPDAVNLALVITGANRYQFQRRVATGGSSSYTSGTQAPPVWLKLVRVGNTFTGYRSSNGTTWTSLGSHTVAMAQDVAVGLVMSSANNAVAGLATFDGVAVTP